MPFITLYVSVMLVALNKKHHHVMKLFERYLSIVVLIKFIDDAVPIFQGLLICLTS